MCIVRVAVIESNGQYLVRPAVVFLSKTQGDTFRLINRTTQTLTLSAIGTSPFEASLSTPVNIGSGDRRDLPLAPSPVGSFSYRVEVGEGRVVAQGNSDPVIIIDDP